MNKKLRQLLGRGTQRDSSTSNSKKKRKRGTLSSLLSQRSTATQNYYFKSINGESKDCCLKSQTKHAILKKEGDLTVDTESSGNPDNTDRVLEVILEPTSNENADRPSEPVEDQTKLLIKGQDDSNSCDTAKIDKSLFNAVPLLVNVMTPQTMEEVLKVTSHDKTDPLFTTSTFELHNLDSRAKSDDAGEGKTPNPKNIALQTNDHDSEKTVLDDNKNTTYKDNASFSQLLCDAERNDPVRTLNVQSASRHTTSENSMHCDIVQQPHHAFSQESRYPLTNAIKPWETETKLSGCQHQHCMESLRKRQGDDVGSFNRDCDWGWVSNGPENNNFAHSPLCTELENSEHSEGPGMRGDNTQNRSCSHATSQHSKQQLLQHRHQDIPRHFSMPKECTSTHCPRRRQEHFQCCKTSTSSCCAVMECQHPEMPSPPPHADGCRNQCSLSATPSYSTVSFSIRDQNCFTTVLQIPCLPQDERGCTHRQVKHCSCGHCHGNVAGCSTRDWEPRTSRACKRHLVDADCSESFREKSAMAPSVVLFPHLQSVCGPAASSHQSCCCRRAAASRECRQLGGASNRYTVTKPVATSYDRTRRSDTFPGHFQLSSKAYAKLIAYCHSKKLLIGLPHDNNTFSHSQTWHDRNLMNAFESPLQRTPTHACNEYFELGQRLKSRLVYENQAAIELCRLAQVFETVEECPWYWGELSGQEAQKLLTGTPVGTFLLRDSSERRYLFSLSMMTRQGPTSIRIVYTNGIFRFDSDRDDETDNSRRRFSAPNAAREPKKHQQCVIQMILHYTDYLTGGGEKAKKHSNTFSFPNACSQQVNSNPPTSASDPTTTEARSEIGNDTNSRFRCSWVGRGGRKEIQVVLAHPYPKQSSRSLQESCRMMISKNLRLWENPEKVEDLPLSAQLKESLKQYPYPV